MNVTAMMPNSVTTVRPPAKLPSTVRCDRLSVFLDSLLSTLSSLPSATNLQPPVTTRLLSTERRVQAFLRAWLSMLPQAAVHTTVQILTTAVTPSRRMAKTRRCTNKVISTALLSPTMVL